MCVVYVCLVSTELKEKNFLPVSIADTSTRI